MGAYHVHCAEGLVPELLHDRVLPLGGAPISPPVVEDTEA
jgi:hypothetical protein